MVESIWNKVGKLVKKAIKIIKNMSILPLKVLIYPMKKPSASINEMQHDAKVSLKKTAGVNVPKEEKKYNPPIGTTEASKNLGVQVIKQGKGLVIFLASRTLTGDISCLTEKQLDKIEELNSRYSSVHMDKENNRIMITVDVEKIISSIRSNSKHREKSQEEVKQLVINKIYDEADRTLKGIARVAGGEFVTHTDRKLLYGIGEMLYQKSNKWLSKAISYTEKSPRQSLEVIANIDFNITDPNNFPYGKKEGMFPIKLPQSIGKQARKFEIKRVESNLSNLEGVSSSKIREPSFIFNKEKEGKGRS
ncbi:hypothetical protein HSX44_01290 [Wolbachia endosymbiont of Onchocerca gibsoni]|uniref:hypothetical protein n=1 Tax=Wolbachia endosymbiont of Onchocerca gibsoni TaxID=118986 RepID=UPI0023D80162|nr:hypothetical protein [Wolbachia endosymbiont of Onchocerca gibsoni]MDF0607535.1 hypothetical protein [Wolbachia endosymbiont of Onchocerca gibsoni]